jgi:hypothetical protein
METELTKLSTKTNKQMKKTLSTNTKANLIAFGIMAVILTLGLIYGLELSNSFYLTENY